MVTSQRTGRPTRIGPIDVANVLDGERTALVRWSHLAGDARTFQEFVVRALDAIEPRDARTCRCVEFPVDAVRPLVPADAWNALRDAGEVGGRHALEAFPAAVLPLVRPVRPALGGFGDGRRRHVPIDESNDAMAVVRLRSRASTPGQPSRFASVAAAVARLIAGASGRHVVRVGLTVDVRRHERISGSGTAGNLSVVGYINVRCAPGDDEETAARHVHGQVQALLQRSFWRQQLAFDAGLGRLPVRALERGCDVIMSRFASLAPVVVTELWRDDAPRCKTCGRPRGRLPEGMSALAIPPALPPAGLTCGITRDDDVITVVLRRITRPGTAALASLERLVSIGGYDEVEMGSIVW